ncbi:MAG: HD domain-containing protein [bacterium]|nr:HD domain-containing protein [bacterium]
MDLHDAEKLVRKNLSKDIEQITEKFAEHDYDIFIVGGFIRDLILGRSKPGQEMDLATNARPEEIKKIFRRTIPTGIRHGTITLIWEEKTYEITTFRADGKYTDGRHPDTVRFSKTIEEDLSRRDFTINALAFDLRKQRLIDHHEGLKDLEAGIIRTIGNPDDRFQEDGLRLMRAIRFATVLNFRIEEKTRRSISKNLYMLSKVAMERIKDEFVKLMQAEKPSQGIEFMRKSEMLRKLIPELLTGFGLLQNKFHKYDVYYHLLYSCDAAPGDNLNVRLAALFHDVCKPATRLNKDEAKEATFYNHEILSSLVAKKILKRMKFSNEIINKVEKLIALHMFYYTDEWTDSAVRRFLRKAGLDLLDELFVLREADRIGNGTKEEKSKHLEELKKRIRKILDEENAFSLKHLKINGQDVMRIKGIPPSPLVGKILNAIMEKVLEDSSLNTKEKLEELVKEYKES